MQGKSIKQSNTKQLALKLAFDFISSQAQQ